MKALYLNYLFASQVVPPAPLAGEEAARAKKPKQPSWVKKYLYLHTFAPKQRLLLFGVVLTMILGADMVTKSWAEKHLVRAVVAPTAPTADRLATNEVFATFPGSTELYALKEIEVVPNFWSFFYTRNYNIGFSLLGFLERTLSPHVLAYLVLTLQALTVLGLIVYFLFTRLNYFMPLALIIGGGLANVLDRAFRGYVVDFIKWYWEGSPIALLNPWPLFNLADTSISLGIFLFILGIVYE